MTAITNFKTAWTDLLKNFWEGAHASGCITPQWEGYTSLATAQAAGASNDDQVEIQVWLDQDQPMAQSLWCEAHYANLIYWYWKHSGSKDCAAMLQANFNQQFDVLGPDLMTDAADPDGIVGASDDAAWIAQMYWQVYDATGDARALQAAKDLLVSARTVYAGPEANKYGLYYTLPSVDPNHRSSLYEVGIAIAAYQIWESSGQTDAPWYETALNAYTWMQQYLLHPSGAHWCEFGLDTLQPIGIAIPGDTSKMYLAGSMGMAVLGAMLYAYTKKKVYLTDTINCVEGIVEALGANKAVSGMTQRYLLNNRDANTEGYYFPAFVKYVVPLAGINPQIKDMITFTATQIVKNARTLDGFYSGDWTGGNSWTSQGETAQQMQVSASAVSVVLGAAMLGVGV